MLLCVPESPVANLLDHGAPMPLGAAGGRERCPEPLGVTGHAPFNAAAPRGALCLLSWPAFSARRPADTTGVVPGRQGLAKDSTGTRPGPKQDQRQAARPRNDQCMVSEKPGQQSPARQWG